MFMLSAGTFFYLFIEQYLGNYFVCDFTLNLVTTFDISSGSQWLATHDSVLSIQSCIPPVIRCTLTSLVNWVSGKRITGLTGNDKRFGDVASVGRISSPTVGGLLAPRRRHCMQTPEDSRV